jgi:hypothetical protein
VENAVRGGRSWRAAACKRHHAAEAARREVRQQRGERHRVSGWVLNNGFGVRSSRSRTWPQAHKGLDASFSASFVGD